jgi:hypothetical protein
MRINQEESLSIWTDIFPNIWLLATSRSVLLPVSTFTAGMEVTMATERTKTKLTFDLRAAGNSGMKIIPVSGSKRAKNNNNDSVIDI